MDQVGEGDAALGLTFTDGSEVRLACTTPHSSSHAKEEKKHNKKRLQVRAKKKKKRTQETNSDHFFFSPGREGGEGETVDVYDIILCV